jgi:hypothetical protein
MSQSACVLPTPNTVWVRVVLKAQRVQAATRARSSSQSRGSSRDGELSGARADGAVAAGGASGGGTAAAIAAAVGCNDRDASGTLGAARRTQASSPKAARYS